MAASGDGIHDSSGLHDNSGGAGNSDPLMSQASGHDLGGGGSRSPHNMTNSNNTVLCEGTDFRVMTSMTDSSAAGTAGATYAAAFTNGGGRLSPSQFSGSSNSSSYATLTPLQPLPPISSVSEKFSQHSSNSNSNNAVATPQGFHFITPNHQLSVHNITNTYQYAAAQFAPLLQSGGYSTGAYTSPSARTSFPPSVGSSSGYENHLALANSLNYPSPQRHTNLAGSSSPFTSSNVQHHNANGVSLTIQLPGGLAVQSQFLSQQAVQDSLENSHHDRSTPSHHHHHNSSSSPGATPNSSPRQIVVDNSPTNSHHSHHSHGGGTAGSGNEGGGGGGTTTNKHRSGGGHRAAAFKTNGGAGGAGGGGGASAAAAAAASADEMEEINTKELAQRISAELKRYSIPQAIFAQRVLCRSQGTLSDLLRNPKPWSKLKSGRETFRRMGKWLEEPEFQRMTALRLAGKKTRKRADSNFITATEVAFSDCVPVCLCVCLFACLSV